MYSETPEPRQRNEVRLSTWFSIDENEASSTFPSTLSTQFIEEGEISPDHEDCDDQDRVVRTTNDDGDEDEDDWGNLKDEDVRSEVDMTLTLVNREDSRALDWRQIHADLLEGDDAHDDDQGDGGER